MFKPEGFDSLEEVADAIGAYQPHRKRPKNLDGLGKNLRLGADASTAGTGTRASCSAPRLDTAHERLEACARA
jgi:hypothetical protein